MVLKGITFIFGDVNSIYLYVIGPLMVLELQISWLFPLISS